MKTPVRKTRCAIYTRKSSEEGLEMEFNSLEAQREAGLSYIASQKHARVGFLSATATTMAASPAAAWSGRGCNGCCVTSSAAPST